jgi:hypothetical protein
MDTTMLTDLIARTKEYVHLLVTCLEQEDYGRLGAIDEEYRDLQDALAALPEEATEYFPEEWEIIDVQLQSLRDIMLERQDSLRSFIEKADQAGLAAKSYERNTLPFNDNTEANEDDDSWDIPIDPDMLARSTRDETN